MKIPRVRTTKPVLINKGNDELLSNLDVAALPRQLNCQMLMGRDLIARFFMAFGPIPSVFPDELSRQNAKDKELNMDFFERRSLLSDFKLDPEKEKTRGSLRERLKARLEAHMLKVPIDGFINHPQATVHLTHDAEHPTSFTPQYKFKNPIVVQTITDWVKKMVDEKRFTLYDKEIHGDALQNNVPLMVTPAGTRVCADLRNFNKGLRLDPSLLANIPNIYHEMGSEGYTVFTELDLRGAFLQFMVAKQDQHKLVITWGGKQYVSRSALFGLAHMAQICSRVLTLIFADHKNVKIYCDNIVIGSKTFLEHEKDVVEAIDKCDEFNIRLNPDKCKLAYAQLKTLGNVISEKGLYPDPERVLQIMNWVQPSCPSSLSSFLSVVNYLRIFIRHYSTLTAGLNKLKTLKPAQFTAAWQPKHSVAFLLIKKALAAGPLLKHPDWNKQFTIVVDASITGLGGVLYQPSNPRDPPTPDTIVQFFSRSLKDYEKGFSVYRLELSAIIFGLRNCDEFLYGRHFTILTDHGALTFLESQKNVNRILLGHFAALSEYSFSIFHLPGRLNKPSDGLSRMYQKLWDIKLPDKKVKPASKITEEEENASIYSMHLEFENTMHSELEKFIGVEDIASERLDALEYPEYKDLPKTLKKPKNKEDTISLIKAHHTASEKSSLVKSHHTAGHFGTLATLRSLQREGWSWIGMRGVIEEVIANCPTCQRWSPGKMIYHPVGTIPAALPWDRIQVDMITSFEDSIDNNKYIMVIYDVMSGFTQLRATKDRTARECASTLWEVLMIFGPPKIVQTDGDGSFISEIFSSMIEQFGSQHVTIPAYVPRINGGVERTVQTVSTLLRKMQSDTNMEWDQLIPWTQLMINIKHKELTGSCPFVLFFNRRINLFESYTNRMSEEDDTYNLSDALELWKEREQRLHNVIFPSILLNKDIMKKSMAKDFAHRHTVSENRLPAGAMVMLSDVVRRDKNSPPWLGPFTIVRVMPNGVYTLQDMAGGIYNRDCPREHLKLLSKNDIHAIKDAHYVTRISDYRDVIHLNGVKTREYEVVWADGSTPSWEPIDNFDDQKAIRDFWATKKNVLNLKKPIYSKELTYVVEEIIKYRKTPTGENEFLVRWVGFEELTWEPTSSFKDGSMLNQFMSKNKDLTKLVHPIQDQSSATDHNIDEDHEVSSSTQQESVVVPKPIVLNMGDEIPVIPGGRSSRVRVVPKRLGI